LIQRWSAEAKPRLFLGVDAPDFNLTLETEVKKAGVPTIHLVCPSIWAWRMERIHKIKQACDHVLCIFPFEPDILAREGISATYIGHPMAHLVPLEVDAQVYRRSLQLNETGPLLAVLPGSRKAEVSHLGPLFIETCLKLKADMPDLRFVTPLPSGPLHDSFKRSIPGNLADCWTILEGQSHEALGASDAVLLASGTATLEAMMFKKPMVIAYKMPWLSYQMMKGKGYLPYVGLPNILLQQFAVPEFIQDRATSENLRSALLVQLDDTENRAWLQAQFTQQHHKLLRPSGQLCAQVLEQYL
ncbi:MAG: lipid-A-disaccharide synthase, partial [Limnobacter sp.]|nr:lipid-A-disaccharide synthase [Limnobacter sp.]